MAHLPACRVDKRRHDQGFSNTSEPTVTKEQDLLTELHGTSTELEFRRQALSLCFLTYIHYLQRCLELERKVPASLQNQKFSQVHLIAWRHGVVLCGTEKVVLSPSFPQVSGVGYSGEGNVYLLPSKEILKEFSNVSVGKLVEVSISYESACPVCFQF